MSRITGKLQITLHEGRELHSEDFGKMDPFVKIELKKDKFKSKVHKKGGQNPKWDQTILINVRDASPNEIIHFQVWDEDLLSDDKIGRADLPLTSLALHTDKKEGHWIQLVNFDNFKKIAGYIRIGVAFEGTGWPAKPEEKKERPPSPKHERPPSPKHERPPSPKHERPPSPKPEHKEHHEEHKEHKDAPAYSGGAASLPLGHKLTVDQKLTSPNGRFTATLLRDGNFVVFDNGKGVWATKTQDIGGDFLIVRKDGNLVLWEEHLGCVWQAEVHGDTSGGAQLTMQDDGNLVLYHGSSAAWATGVPPEPPPPKRGDTLHEGKRLGVNEELRSANGKYRLVLQHDSNLVIYDGSRPIWASATADTGARTLVLQEDHNLVLYDGQNAPKWASHTCARGDGATRVTLTDDGDLELHAEDGRVWSSKSGVEEKKQHQRFFQKNEKFEAGQKLVSPNGRFVATIQDGNFVVLDNGVKAWEAATTGAVYAKVQDDGNWAIWGPSGECLWQARVLGDTRGGARLELHNDGNLVLWHNTSWKMWESGVIDKERKSVGLNEKLFATQTLTAPNGRYKTTLLANGNLVTKNRRGEIVWETKTRGAEYARVQDDGNLALWGPSGECIWQARVMGDTSKGARLEQMNDGNLLLYHGDSSPWWSGYREVTKPTLLPNEPLWVGKWLISKNSRFEATVTPEGNFELYDGGKKYWDTKTTGADHLILQTDGNVALWGPHGCVWQARVLGGTSSPDNRLELHDDGNLVLWLDNPIKLAWMTGTRF